MQIRSLRLSTKVQQPRSKQEWHTIGGKKIYCRSTWEARFAKYLQLQKDNQIIKEWEYEPKTFWFEDIKRGVRSYMPDFKVTRPDDSHYWVEVKGYFDKKSLTKIKRFKKYYPQEFILVVDEKWFRLYGQKI